jgi:DNA-binding response OmpR family regulator
VVLIVEDDTVNQKLLADICRAEGYEVVLADDGERALEVFGEREVHVVLVDATMPRKDGFAVSRQIRAHGDVPVIMVTASMEAGVQNRAAEAGATAFVAKPFRVYELTRHIRSALVAFRSPSEPPTSQRLVKRRAAAASLSRVQGAVDLRVRLRREAEFQGQERACMVVRLANQRQILESAGRHATDAVLGAVGTAMLAVLGEGAVFWADAVELVGLMGAEQLAPASEAAHGAHGGIAPMRIEPVVLALGAVQYTATATVDVELLLQEARAAAREVEWTNDAEHELVGFRTERSSRTADRPCGGDAGAGQGAGGGARAQGDARGDRDRGRRRGQVASRARLSVEASRAKGAVAPDLPRQRPGSERQLRHFCAGAACALRAGRGDGRGSSQGAGAQPGRGGTR